MSTSQTSGFDKISPTAILTAYARQPSDIPYTREIAELTNAQETLNQFLTSKEQQEPTVLGLAIDQLKSVFTLDINLDRIKAGLSELSVFALTLA